MSFVHPTLPSTSRATPPSSFTTRRPWDEFFALHSFTRPYSFPDATRRIKRNICHFRVNYAMLVLFAVFVSLLWHPISLIVFLAAFVAWFFLYFFRDGPIVLLGRAIDDRLILAVLSVVTAVALILTGVWLNVLVSFLVGAAIVVLHAVFRNSDDLYVDEQEVSDGGLLSFVSGSPTKRTGYTRMS